MAATQSTQVIRPDPDPTVLTTENLRREIANLKAQVDIQLASNDKAIQLVQVATDTAIGNLQKFILAHIETLASVTTQRFASIETQFLERDKRTEQLSLADKTAIAAALQAQKEAAGAQNESNAASVLKQEAAFTKLLDQTQALFQTSMSAITTQINDLKSRLDSGEGQSKGKSDIWGYIVGVAGILIAFGTLIVLVLRSSH